MSRTVRFSLALGLVFAWAGNNIAKADTGASAFKWSFSDVCTRSHFPLICLSLRYLIIIGRIHKLNAMSRI